MSIKRPMPKGGEHTLVLLPGMMCDERLFASQIAQLKQDFGQQLSIVTPSFDKADSIQKLAEIILAELPSRFSLCGLSMGGILAMEILAQAPQRIERLALMDTNPLAETPEGVIRRNRQIKDVQAGRLRQVISEEMKPLYLAESPNKQDVLDICMDMAMRLGAPAFICQSLALRDRPDQTQTLRQVTCPTLILYGAEDRLCPPERHHLMKELIEHARLVQIDHAAHLPPLESPDATYAQIHSWLVQS